MIYGFDVGVDEHDAATAALLVYAVWCSRDRKRHRITPEVWGQNERFVKSAAKRATTLPEFLERLKPRLSCDTIHPRAMAVGIRGVPVLTTSHGEIIELAGEQDEQREFLTGVLQQVSHRRVLELLYRETSYVVLLVRERLERERPIRQRFETDLDRKEEAIA